MAISKSVVAAILSFAFVFSVAQADTDIQSELSQIRQDGVGQVVMKGTVLHVPKVDSWDDSTVEHMTEGIFGVLASIPSCKGGNALVRFDNVEAWINKGQLDTIWEREIDLTGKNRSVTHKLTWSDVQSYIDEAYHKIQRDNF